MKKKVIALLLMCLMVFSCVGCGKTYQEATNTNGKKDYCNGYFTVITKWSDNNRTYRIVYANDTKVKYLIISGGNQLGITPLYNADGTLQVYEETSGATKGVELLWLEKK